MDKRRKSLLETKLIRRAVLDSFRKLDPRVQIQNVVMFVTELGAAACTFVLLRQLLAGGFSGFDLHITLWLWFTVLFANFAEAPGRGPGQSAGG